MTPGAEVVQGAGTHLLAGPRLAHDQHRRVRARESRHQPDGADECRVPAAQPGHANFVQQTIARAAMVSARPGQQTRDPMTQLEGPDRRTEKVVRDPGRQVHQILIAVRHDRDDGRADRVTFDRLEEGGHHRVRSGDDRDDHVEGAIGNVLAGDGAPVGAFAVEGVIGSERAVDRRVRRVGIILDDEYTVSQLLEVHANRYP